MKSVSDFDAIGKLLPAVQAAVKNEIADRIVAGEAIAGIDSKLAAELSKRKRALLQAPKPYPGKKATTIVQRQGSKRSAA